MVLLGAPVFTTGKESQAEQLGLSIHDPQFLAWLHVQKGYKAAYAPSLDVGDTAGIEAYRTAFEKQNIVFAELGYWENINDTNEVQRKAKLDGMVNAMAVADALGARCAVNVTGSLVEGSHGKHVAANFSEDAFALAVDNARYVIDSVKPTRSTFAYEIYQFTVVDSVDSLERLIKAVDRPQFAVHLDLVNFGNSPRTYYSLNDILDDCIKRFGDKIVACHIKDARMRDVTTVVIEEVQPGTGEVDLGYYLAGIHALPAAIPVMSEHLGTEAEYDAAIAHLRACAERKGIM